MDGRLLMTTDTASAHHDHADNHAPSTTDLPDSKRDALKRLKYIEGHLGGVRRMIE